jgi:glycosyltransferase involved in cell wall biosynthesis
MRVAILTNIIPKYRENFYDILFSEKKHHINVFCQNHLEHTNVPSISDKYPKNVTHIRSMSLGGEFIVIHRLPYIELLKKYDLYFIDGNPRNISHLFASFIFYILNRKVVIWSMIHSSNNNPLQKRIRLIWLKIFKYHFVYNEKELDFLKNMGFSKKVLLSMNNGLNQDLIEIEKNKWSKEKLEKFKILNRINDRKILISSGRLMKKAKYDLMILALNELIHYDPTILWLLIGTGEEDQNLRKMVYEKDLEKNVVFLGEIYNESELTPWFLSATAFVHPGTIGLSLMQAYGYELPVVTHGNHLIHAPEYNMFEHGVNGLNFIEGDYNSLKDSILSLLYGKLDTSKMRENNIEIVRNKHNTRIMAKKFLSMIELLDR